MKTRSVAGFLGGVIAAVMIGPAGAAAQVFGHPIYPGYQGFIDNPDGSVTMVFQYFSHNRDPIEIPPGPRNGFNGVVDRNQPTTFLPGNHENICVIIVESREAAQTLRWTVAFPELESTTSSDPLNLEYMLTEGSITEAKRDLDVAKAPRGVCLNKPPRVRAFQRRFGGGGDGDGEDSGPQVKVGEELQLNGSVNDEGLPRDGTVTSTWRKTSGPGEVSFADPNAPRTVATFTSPGTYELELHATDGELEKATQIKIEVGD